MLPVEKQAQVLSQGSHSEMGKDPGLLPQLRVLSSWELPQEQGRVCHKPLRGPEQMHKPELDTRGQSRGPHSA